MKYSSIQVQLQLRNFAGGAIVHRRRSLISTIELLVVYSMRLGSLSSWLGSRS